MVAMAEITMEQAELAAKVMTVLIRMAE
jgi:hypothetical protein